MDQFLGLSTIGTGTVSENEMIKRLTFAAADEVTNPGDDSRSFLFPFAMITTDLIGSPEERLATTTHRLIVTIQNSRLPAWRLTEAQLIKVLFEIGRRVVAERAKTGRLGSEHREMVSTASHSQECPFDPSRLGEPNGATFEIEEDRRIGFQIESK